MKTVLAFSILDLAKVERLPQNGLNLTHFIKAIGVDNWKEFEESYGKFCDLIGTEHKDFDHTIGTLLLNACGEYAHCGMVQGMKYGCMTSSTYKNSSVPNLFQLTLSLPEYGYQLPFPNGFESWHETHYEVVAHIEATKHIEGSSANLRMENGGTGGLYLLAQEWTDGFEKLHVGREWDGEFFDELAEYLDKQ